VGLKEYLEIIGGIILIIGFLSPLIFVLIKAKIMPSVKYEIKNNNESLKKDLRSEIQKNDAKIISLISKTTKEEIKNNEEIEEEKRQLRSQTYSEKIDNLKQLVARNEEQRRHETTVIFEILDSIKSEINSLSKTMVNHEGRIIENKERITKIEKSK
jgi:ribonuclease D